MNARTVSFYVMSVAAVGGYLLWQGYERRRMVEDLRGSDRQAVYESTITGFKRSLASALSGC